MRSGSAQPSSSASRPDAPSIGLSVRSTFRRPAGGTFLAIGVSMMLFGGIQMMTSGIQTAFVGGVTEDG